MSSPIEKLVGPTLLRGKTEVPTAEALAGKKVSVDDILLSLISCLSSITTNKPPTAPLRRS